MEPGFRASMNWLHTWAGVVLGGLLFAIFWMGTLAVFDREIDRWMAPMTRLALPARIVSVESPSLRALYDEAVAAKAPSWSILFPTEREPALRVSWRGSSGLVQRFLDPATGAALPDAGTWAGTRFIFPFHYTLHIGFANLGYWIVGFAAMAMMALAVSGVIVHRKIFTEFFTFRPEKKARRLILDLHNVAGVLGFPFHVLITLSGLIIFWTVYFPSVGELAYQGDRKAWLQETFGNFNRPKVNKPAGMAPFDAMIEEARRNWQGDPVRYVFVRNLGDEAAVVQVGRLDDDSVSTSFDVAYFDGPTGALIGQRTGTPAVMTVQRFLSGLHLVQFSHWSLRWLYFGLGLTGCVLIATGYLFWLESRRKKHATLGLRGVRIVEGLTIGSVTGIIIATLAFFTVNRLLPLGATVLGYDRAALEIWTFYFVWLASFGHAWLRPQRAWTEQCRMVAILALAAVLLNGITTGDHLLRSLAQRHLWPIAAMDLLLLAGAALATVAAVRTHRHSVPARQVRHA